MTKKIEFTERGILLPPEIDDVTRRDFLKGSAGLLVLGAAGCGGDGGDETSGETRTFMDSRGVEVEVPDRAERIVAVHDFNSATQVLSLGFSLVGLPTRSGEITPEVAEVFDVEGVETVGEVGMPNLEKIATLDPDLIVADAFDGEPTLEPGVIESLEGIAPVVCIDALRAVDEVMEDHARLLDARGELDEQRTEYEERIADFRDRLEAAPEEFTVSFIQFIQGGVATHGANLTALQNIIGVIGFSRPELAEEIDPNGSTEISLEEMGRLDGDVVLWDLNGADFTDEPLFQRLAAVEAGQAFPPPETGFGGTCYETYGIVLDYLEEIFFENDLDPNVFG